MTEPAPTPAKPSRSPVSTGSGGDVNPDPVAIATSAGAKKAGRQDEIPNDLWRAVDEARRSIRPLADDPKQASHYAHHPGQNLATRFEDRGISIRPAGEGAWELAMTSASAGENSTLSFEGTRAEYRHPDGIVEWFDNRAEGIEHGFTLARPPAGNDGIALTVRLDGLTPEASGEGGDLLLRSADGEARLRYSGLKVWDADGDPLPATMEASGQDIRIAVNDQGATYPVTVDPLITRHRERIDMAQPALGDSHNQFGQALAFDGETALVGVPNDDTLFGQHAGSVYVFQRDGGAWTHVAWLTAGDSASVDLFGSAIALQGDTAFIGAPGAAAGGGFSSNRGCVYVFSREGGTWAQQAVLLGTDGTSTAGFGSALAVSGDTLLVGAPEEVRGTSSNPQFPGCAYIFDRSGDLWNQSTKLTAADGEAGDMFGTAVALEGDRAMVGAPDDNAEGGLMEGSVYAFVRNAEGWSHSQTLRMTGPRNDARFGSAIDLEGNTLLIGAPLDDGPGGIGSREGGAFVFAESGGSWSLQSRLDPTANGVVGFGRSVVLDGDQAIVGAPGWYRATTNAAGRVYVFHRDEASWSVGTSLAPADSFVGDDFGFPLALGGQTLLAGRGTAGSYAFYTKNGVESVHVFTESSGTWQPEALLRPTDGGDESHHGTAVALDGDRCVIGLPYDDSGVNDYRHGSAYILKRETGAWTLESRLTHPIPNMTAEFGLAVGLEDDLVVIGSENGAFAYRRSESGWDLEEALTPSGRAKDDKFGGAVAISQGRIAVGAPFIHYRSFGSHGIVYLFARDRSDWNQIARLEANETFTGYHSGDLFGQALAFEGDRLLVGAPSRYSITFKGRAYVFGEQDGVWTKEATLAGVDWEHPDRFGSAVALDGDQILIGAPGDNLAYAYHRQAGAWELRQTLAIPELGEESRFGSAVTLEGEIAMVGAPRFFPQYTGNAPVPPGSAHLFETEDGIWNETLTLRGDGTTGDAFGFSLAMDGKHVLVGAPWDDFLTSPTGNVAPDQGSAYFFEIGSEVSVFIGHFDANADGTLSQDEWRSIYAAPPKKDISFGMIDADQSDSLDEAELRAARDGKKTAKTLGRWLRRAAAFLDLDTDQDGRITRTEIVAMWMPGTNAGMIDSAWNRIQTDGALDFRAWIRARTLPSLPVFEAATELRSERRTLFRRLDSNEDAQVSREEFAQMFHFKVRPNVIESAWRVATGTPKKSEPPASITLASFVEAPKLPKPDWE